MLKPQHPDMPLRNDVRLLGDILGQVILEQLGQNAFEKIENIRLLSKSSVCDDKKNIQEKLNNILKQLNPSEILNVVRAFSHFLNLTNIAEDVHRLRRIKWYAVHRPEKKQPGSLAESFERFKKHKISPQKVEQAIAQLDIDLVLTAHPTEVMRRTLMLKFDKIASNLQALSVENLTVRDKIRFREKIKSELTAIWHTDEIRQKKPTPIDEAKWGFAVVETSLWQAVPNFLRALDYQLKEYGIQHKPIMKSPVRFSSWMGGDRDGNPFVLPKTTASVCLMSRWVCADLCWGAVNQLGAVLSMRNCSDKIRLIVGDSQEPYRKYLRPVKKKLLHTKQSIEKLLSGELKESPEGILLNKSDILVPLMNVYESLCENGCEVIANDELLDLIRRVNVFGVTLMPIDIRQHKDKHSGLMSHITSDLKLGVYQEWDEAQKLEFLLKYLHDTNIMVSAKASWSDTTKEVWQTFEMIGKQLPESLGVYVISMAVQPSDVLLVCLLQKLAGVAELLPVVPLFETLEALQNAPQCIALLLDIPWYKTFIRGKQQIMLGYSDSTKESGIVTSAWALYQAQAHLTQVAQKKGTHIIFFHGRGGSVGRGGAPAHLAILSQPPGSIQGALRITEQGEVVRNKYGLVDRAQRTLELYVTATLQSMLMPAKQPKPKWQNIMQALSDTGQKQYQNMVRQEDFAKYFEYVTPVNEISALRIGSRPAKRPAEHPDISHLRAIPWMFAWTQNRLILPSWLGVGNALAYGLEDNKNLIREMVKEWSFFRTLLSLIDMVLAKSDIDLFDMYDKRLAPSEFEHIGDILKQEYQSTLRYFKLAMNEKQLLESNWPLKRSIALRAPYLYPLHFIQAELLARLRQSVEVEEVNSEPLKEDEKNSLALLISLSGIAAGVRNTG